MTPPSQTPPASEMTLTIKIDAKQAIADIQRYLDAGKVAGQPPATPLPPLAGEPPVASVTIERHADGTFTAHAPAWDGMAYSLAKRSFAGAIDFAREHLRDGSAASPVEQHRAASRAFGDSVAAHVADAFLQVSQAVNGSGAAYAADFEKITAALQGIANAPPDTLTASALAALAQTQTKTLRINLAELKTTLADILRQLRANRDHPGHLAA